jgi:outer membrane cobalamin receptor
MSRIGNPLRESVGRITGRMNILSQETGRSSLLLEGGTVKRIVTAAICLIVSAGCLSAGDEVFLSLTKGAKPAKELPANTATVTNAEITESKPLALADSMKDKAGIVYGQYGTLGGAMHMMIRGSSSEQVLVLIDGRRVNDPSMGLVDTGAIPMDSVERVEIIRGGLSSMYGTGAFGGVVNIITRQPVDETPSLDLSISAGSLNTRSFEASVQAKKGALSTFVTAGKTLSDGFRANSDYDANDFFARFGYDAGLTGQFDLTTSFNRRKFGDPGPGVSLDAYDGTLEKTASADAIEDSDSSYWRLGHVKDFGELTLKSSLYASDKDKKYTYPSNFEDDEYRTFVYGGDAQVSNRGGATAGAEWWEEKNKQLDNMFSTVLMDKSRVVTAVYIQQELNAGKFTFIPSVRYDDNSAFGGVASPHITAVYRAGDRLKLSANSGKIWRAPTFNELYWPYNSFTYNGTTYVTLGNKDLSPEEGIASDFGAQYDLQNFTVKLVGFYTQSRNLINWVSAFDPVTNTSTYATENIGKAVQTGAEFELGHKLAPGLYHKFNYTNLWAEDTENKTRLTYRPMNTANYGISWMLPSDTRFDVSAQYVSEVLTGTTPSVLPEYTLLNAGVSQKLRDIELWAKVNNLADKKYQTRAAYNGGYPLPGITYTAGVKVKFWG